MRRGGRRRNRGAGPKFTRPRPAAIINRRRAAILLASLAVTFGVLRVYLSFAPNTDLEIGGYNIHHLFTGLLLVTFGGIAAVLLEGGGRSLDVATAVFGIGLGMALDEWVYLIATDGTNEAYLLPVSLWGGAIMVGSACALVLTLLIFTRGRGG
jgi:hypothetical protein